MSITDRLRRNIENHYGRIYNEALDDVQEALTNPTDEQVKQVARAMGRARERNPRWRRLSGWERDLADARAVLAAAAGGDQ